MEAKMVDRDDWLEDHGYWHWRCSKCGMTGWTDTRPECACPTSEEDALPNESQDED